VEEWDFSSGTLERSFRLPTNSGSVSYVAAFPNGQHVIWFFLFISFFFICILLL